MMSRFRMNIVLLFVSVVLVSAAGESLGTVIGVPGDYPTIQAGIDAAASGDTVRVESGTYTGPGNRNLSFSGKNIVLESDAGADFTTIDCQGAARGFSFNGGEDATAVVDGFTITNGSAGNGGGILVIENSGPTFKNCRIDNCSATSWGGGVFVSDLAFPTFVDCTIDGNSAQRGGGVRVGDDLSTQFIDCTITNNSASRGGGVDATDFASSDFSNCTISGNQATDGAGMAVVDSTGIAIVDCTITGNLATNGGGLFIANDAVPAITGCTVAGNRALGNGGGVYVAATSMPLTRTIVWSNCAADTGQQVYIAAADNVTFVCGDVDSSGVEGLGSVVYDANTIFVDPLFCQEYLCTNAPITLGDYTLDDDSQALASNSLCGELIGSKPQGCTSRMFEVADDAQYLKIQDAIDKSVGDVGDVVVVDDKTWTGPRNTELDFGGKNIKLKSQTGAAVIDGGGSVRAIVFKNGEDATSVVEGFTLKGGDPTKPGSAVFVSGGASPVFRDCEIKDNDGPLGVVCVESGAPVFESVVVEQNTVSSTRGVLDFVGGNPKLISSVVRNNTAANAVMVKTPMEISGTQITDNSGCGVCFEFTPTAMVMNSDISRNGDRGVILNGSAATFAGVKFQENGGGGVIVTGIGGGAAASASADGSPAAAVALGPNDFVDCEFSGHSADRGAGYFFDCANEPEFTYTVNFTNCRFSGNQATFEGGAIAICGRATNADILPVFDGCTIASNAAQDGGGIYMGVTDVGIGRVAQAQVDRSILWGNCSTVSPDGEAFVLANNAVSIGCSHAGISEIAGTGSVQAVDVTDGIPAFCDYPGFYYAEDCFPDVTVQGDFNLSPQSPAAPQNHPCGPDQIGAFPVEACLATGVGDQPARLKTMIAPPTPNPFNPVTTVEYSLEVRSHVTVNVYDVQGRLIRELVDREMPAGVHRTEWNGRDRGAKQVASGVYFVRFEAGQTVQTQKMVLLK